METLDGYNLKDGDECWVACQCAMGIHKISGNPRKAVYRDELAISRGFEFTLNNVRSECESIEIVATWKNRPKKE